MVSRVWIAKIFMVLPVVLTITVPKQAHSSSIQYTYDLLGRLTTALYDNGLCISYSFDANGNRLSVSGVTSGPSKSPYWGSGYFGCIDWTASTSPTTPTWGVGVWGQAPWQAH